MRRGDLLLVLLQQPLRLGVGPLGVLELLLDPALALYDRFQEDRESPAPQDQEEDAENDERPDDQPGVDRERTRRWGAARLVRALLQEGQYQQHYASLK